MPIIKVIMGKVDIEKLTSVGVEVTKSPASVFTVLIEELELANIGIGGQTLAEKYAKN